MDEVTQRISYNTALIEQADTERYGKLRELAATLDCLRACSDNRFTYSWETDRIRAAMSKLLNELFPELSVSASDSCKGSNP